MTAPYTEFLRSLKPTDSEAERLAKLLREYGIHKQRDGFVAVRKGRDREEADDEHGHAGDDGEEAEDDEPTAASKQHLVSTIADLLVEGGAAPHRKAALHHLLFHPRGAELVRRLSKKQKETQAMTYNRSEELTSIIKQYGPVALAKYLVENGPSGLSEHEFTAMVETWAKANGITFVKLYTAMDDTGLAIRRATQVLKGFSTAGPVREAVASGSAYDQLMVKANELQKREPHLSREQSFAKAYQQNPELARTERQANRPA